MQHQPRTLTSRSGARSWMSTSPVYFCLAKQKYERPEVADPVAQFESDTPLGRMTRVEEMVGPAIFLLSDAASYRTGVDLLADGGFTCW